MLRNKNIDILRSTLKACSKGYYEFSNKKIPLRLSKEEMQQALVYLPDQVIEITEKKDFPHVHVLGRCGYSCMNADSFTMAAERQQWHTIIKGKGKDEILVLNFANPVNPGGGVRRGARAQEEDLCRRSTLLTSLESKPAQAYYQYNKSLHTNMGSDAIILSPKVEVFKDEKGEVLEKSFTVAVMTCAAPMITYGKEGLSDQEYEELFYNRIVRMLKCAAYWGYKSLVLGAFGCGAFGNDAKLVSDLFYKALKEFNFDGMRESDLFRRIDFAVLDLSLDNYNFNEFYRNFSHFYRDEDASEEDRVAQRIKEKEVNLDAIRGCLLGGAVGDALGYPVEFLSIQDIIADYGVYGICEYELDKKTGKALISDDTQMTLFTANGLLFGDTRGCLRGIQGAPRYYVQMAYKDWYRTQTKPFEEEKEVQRGYMHRISWLCDIPELYARRAPGSTCLSALSDEAIKHNPQEDGIQHPRNSSKGCGGIMRIAPFPLNYNYDIRKMDEEAAQIAALTHGHSLGYMPTAVLSHILNRIVFPRDSEMSLEEIIVEAKNTVAEIFSEDPHLATLTDLIDLAIKLSKNDDGDIDNIMCLGEGWVAEETLAIAIYCSLRYENDFSMGIITSVNHSGDSDSTGAVTGNILGALHGYNAIEDKWKEKLELADVILEIADDLCHGCQMSEYSSYNDPDWSRKYLHAKWKT